MIFNDFSRLPAFHTLITCILFDPEKANGDNVSNPEENVEVLILEDSEDTDSSPDNTSNETCDSHFEFVFTQEFEAIQNEQENVTLPDKISGKKLSVINNDNSMSSRRKTPQTHPQNSPADTQNGVEGNII